MGATVEMSHLALENLIKIILFLKAGIRLS